MSDNEQKHAFDGENNTPWADVVRFYRENFNTQLSPEEEWKFHIWADEAYGDLDALNDYDLRGAFKDGAMSSGNLPDKYKKPNYLTFSEDSLYHGTPDLQRGGEYEGGVWGQKGDERTFTPSKKMLESTHPLMWFKAEMAAKQPDIEVIYPEEANHEC